MHRRWLVVLVLLACSIQTTGALTAFFPDDCSTILSGGASDEEDCANACTRCVCCARRAPTVVSWPTSLPAEAGSAGLLTLDAPLPRAVLARDVFHVPKRPLLS